MKYLFITILLILYSCVDEKRRTEIQTVDSESQKVIEQQKSEIQESQSIFYNNDKKLKVFDFNQLPLSKISINDNLEYSIKDDFRNKILKIDYYYNLIYYSKVFEDTEFKAVTVLGDYDYYTNIVLLTTNIAEDSLIDYKIIASIMGDADELTEISSVFSDSISFKVTTKEKRLTKLGNFETLRVENKIFKITTNGQIEKK